MEFMIAATFEILGERIYAYVYMEDEDGWISICPVVEGLKKDPDCIELQVSRRAGDGGFFAVGHLNWVRGEPNRVEAYYRKYGISKGS